jgi:pseudouridine-5'-phosphate glycosidase
VLDLEEEVRDALQAGRPVVALESTIIAHGLPRPGNADVARQLEAAVRAEGATPATIAVLDGGVRVGLGAEEMERVATDEDLVKASVRDLGPVIASGGSAATTVASTAHIAALAGIQVFATGGLGGVHRGATQTFDESADIEALADTSIVVVCAGVKSILDIGATLERLESRGVAVLGFRTDNFPAFYLSESAFAVPWRVEEVEEVAEIVAARVGLELRQATVVANPIAPDEQMDPALHSRVLTEAISAADAAGVHGKDVTPYVLGYFHEHTGGESLRVNVTLALANARLAARIAGAIACR